MILSDREITAALDFGHIRISPRPDERMWTSTAIDLTLDSVLLEWNLKPVASGEKYRIRPSGSDFNIRQMMDDPDYGKKVPIDPVNGYELEPGQFVLGFTQEIIYLPHRSRISARVEGKSSLARLGVGVHVTAPTIHAGFGYSEDKEEKDLGSPIQLEIFNLGKMLIVLDAGMPICQLILEEVREAPLKGYKGRFNDQAAFAP